MQMISTGRIVQYTLRDADADAVNRRRADYAKTLPSIAGGAQVHVGNLAHVGDVLPMMVVRVFGTNVTTAVNGQVFLDGNDTLWVTSVYVGHSPGTFAWPIREAPRVPGMERIASVSPDYPRVLFAADLDGATA